MKRMITTLLTFITQNTILKICFGYTFSLQALYVLIPKETQVDDFISVILNAVPSKIVGYLGIVYGFAIVFKKISQVWKAHHIDRIDVKSAKAKYKKENE